jgi:predicted dehydrogenase
LTHSPFRVGLLSAAHGHIHSYISCLRRRDDVQIVGLYDDDPVRGQATAQRHGVAFVVEPSQLWQQRLDGVIICAENVKHRPLVEVAARQTPYILCEKPIATTLADAQAMLDACTATGAQLQIAFPVRFAPTIQWLKTRLDQGGLGQVYAVQATNHGRMPGRWFIDPSLAGGGAVMDHTVHVIDLLRWFWQTEVTEVYAEVGHSLLHPGLGVDDVGLLSFTLANGIYGTLDTSWSRPASYPTWGDVKLEITAANGIVYVDAFGQQLAVSADGQDQTTTWASWGSDMDQGLIDDFIETIRFRRSPSISGLDGLRALEVALAAYHSAEIGEPVRLPLA